MSVSMAFSCLSLLREHAVPGSWHPTHRGVDHVWHWIHCMSHDVHRMAEPFRFNSLWTRSMMPSSSIPSVNFTGSWYTMTPCVVFKLHHFSPTPTHRSTPLRSVFRSARTPLTCSGCNRGCDSYLTDEHSQQSSDLTDVVYVYYIPNMVNESCKNNLYTPHLCIPRRMSIFHAKNCITREIYARKYGTVSINFYLKKMIWSLSVSAGLC